MINDLIVNYVILFIVLELYEVNWQKADTIMGMLVRMYQQYSKNIFIFLLMQPTFYFSIGFAMITNYNPYALMLLFIKTMDVATKIQLIELVFTKEELTPEMSVTLLTPIHRFIPYIGLTLYPFLVVFALQ